MWGAVDLEFRRGLGVALLGFALLLAAVFFGLLAVANAPSREGGYAIVGFIFVIIGAVLCMLGAGMIGSRPRAPPAYPAYPAGRPPGP